MARIEKGSVHGRFQPFHNGHLDYVMQAFDRADFLLIGLTQIFQPAETERSGRDSRDFNPLSYYERGILVREALIEAGVPHSRFRITPFPIETPDRLPEFCPRDYRCFTTIVSSWNDTKIKLLEDRGYQVAVLELSPGDNQRVASGSEIRRLIRADDSQWTRFVPVPVAQIIIERFKSKFLTT